MISGQSWVRIWCGTWNLNLESYLMCIHSFIFNISIFFIYRYSFERWPEILVIHMKRFAPTGSYRAKLTSNIHAPLRNLDLRYLLIYYVLHIEFIRNINTVPITVPMDWVLTSLYLSKRLSKGFCCSLFNDNTSY